VGECALPLHAGLAEPLQALVASEQLEWVQHKVMLGYGHLSAEQVLKVMLAGVGDGG
jgi:hypothetical protein